MAGHTLAARLTAVFCLALARFDLAVAVVLFNMLWNAQMTEQVSHVRSFIAHTVDRLVSTGSLRDLPRSGRPTTLTDAVVQRCVKEFKQGYTRHDVIDQRTGAAVMVHKYYSSIYQACSENQYIRGIVERHNISPKHLLRRMHQLSPSLRRLRLDYKLELTPANKQHRSKAGKQMLARIRLDPSYLDRIFWVDEWHVWLTPSEHAQYIWADAFDHHAHTVLPIPRLRRGEHPKVLRCLAIVNARLGPVHLEFTTGTTDLQRTLNKHDDARHPYHVSAGFMLQSSGTCPACLQSLCSCSPETLAAACCILLGMLLHRTAHELPSSPHHRRGTTPAASAQAST